MSHRLKANKHSILNRSTNQRNKITIILSLCEYHTSNFFKNYFKINLESVRTIVAT